MMLRAMSRREESRRTRILVVSLSMMHALPRLPLRCKQKEDGKTTPAGFEPAPSKRNRLTRFSSVPTQF